MSDSQTRRQYLGRMKMGNLRSGPRVKKQPTTTRIVIVGNKLQKMAEVRGKNLGQPRTFPGATGALLTLNQLGKMH